MDYVPVVLISSCDLFRKRNCVHGGRPHHRCDGDVNEKMMTDRARRAAERDAGFDVESGVFRWVRDDRRVTFRVPAPCVAAGDERVPVLCGARVLRLQVEILADIGSSSVVRVHELMVEALASTAEISIYVLLLTLS